MRLLDIVTENFKRLGNFSCNFSTGLNIIAGDNARGKSTLLQAVQAAFFGASTIAGKVENVPTWGQKDFKVTLRFAAKGATYLVVRKKATAKLTRIGSGPDGADEIVANGNTPVTAYIEEMFGLAAKDYSLFWQSKQGESAGILTFGAAALNRKVEEFAGVDLIDKVQARAQQCSTQMAASAEAKAVTEDAMAAAEQARGEASAARDTAQAAMDAATTARDAQAAFEWADGVDSEALRNQQRDAERLWNKVEAAEKALVAAQAALSSAQKNAEGLAKQDGEALQASLAKAKATGTQLAADLEALRDQKASHQRAVDDLARATNAVERAAESLEKVSADFDPAAVTASEAALDEAIATADNAKAAALAAGVKLIGLKELAAGAECPTCGHVKEDHDPAKLAAEVVSAQADHTKLKEAQAAADASVKSARTVLASVQGRVADIEMAKKQFVAAELTRDNAATVLKGTEAVDDTSVNGLNTSVEAARNEYAEINSKLKGVAENNQRWQRAVDAVRTAEPAVTSAEALASALNAEWDALPEPPTDEEVAAAVAAERAKVSAQSTWNAERVALASAVTTANQACVYAEQHLARTSDYVSELFLRNEQAQADADKAQKYSRLVRFLRDKRQAYLQDVWTTVLGMASKLVREATAGEITRITNEEGEFMYEEAGTLAPVSGSASGAQKAAIGVSLRIALARCLYGSESPLIFDEPTAECSERNASGLAATLSTCAAQVLLITHRENDQGLAENIINVGE